MDLIISALYEGALLFKAGIPIRDMYQQILLAYTESPEVTSLFLDLVYDWEHPSNDPLKMVSPFRKREREDRSYRIMAAYTEVAAATSMVDVYWRQCGIAYLLKKSLRARPPVASDVSLARQLLGVFSINHPLRGEFESWASSEQWKQAVLSSCEENVDFESWLNQITSGMTKAARFRSSELIIEAAERLAYPELVGEIQLQWDRFSCALLSV